jgi:hypothetical protein
VPRMWTKMRTFQCRYHCKKWMILTFSRLLIAYFVL